MTDLQREILIDANNEISRHLSAGTRSTDYLLGVAMQAIVAAVQANDFEQEVDDE